MLLQPPCILLHLPYLSTFWLSELLSQLLQQRTSKLKTAGARLICLLFLDMHMVSYLLS